MEEIYFLFILLTFLIFVNGCSSEIEKVCINENCFFVEIADSDEEREIGLMGRSFLEENNGMLFVFDFEGKHGFWMKDTLIPLDIIWINSDEEVVFIKEKANPCNEKKCEIFTPDKKAKYVLEINSGKIKELGIKIGDNVKF